VRAKAVIPLKPGIGFTARTRRFQTPICAEGRQATFGTRGGGANNEGRSPVCRMRSRLGSATGAEKRAVTGCAKVEGVGIAPISRRVCSYRQAEAIAKPKRPEASAPWRSPTAAATHSAAAAVRSSLLGTTVFN
jgi:hypothetical protein